MRALWACGGALAWVTRAVLVLSLVGAVLLAVGLAVLAWRLSQGPVDVSRAVHWIEDTTHAKDSPARLHIATAAVAWQGFGQGADRALDLQLRDIKITEADRTVAEVASADITLSPAALLLLQVVPRTVSLDGLRLQVLRAVDGTVTFDLGSFDLGGPEAGSPEPGSPGSGSLESGSPESGSTTEGGTMPGASETLAALNRPASTDRGNAVSPGLRHIGQLRSVRLRDAALTVTDRQIGATLAATDVSLDLQRRAGGGVVGNGTAALAVGGAASRLTLRAESADQGTRVAMSLTPVSLSALAAALPALAPAAQVEAELELSAVATLSAALLPQGLTLHAAAGGGQARLPSANVAFESLALDATASWANAVRWDLPDRVALPRMQVVVASPAGGWNTTIGASGNAVRQGGVIRSDLALTVDHLAFADLPKLWPAAWGGHVRPWLTENLTAGTARDGQVNLGIEAPANLSSVKLLTVAGTLRGDDVTIHWLRPVPPIEHAQALLTINEPDVLEIAIPSARQGAAQLSNGRVRINGLSVKDQFLAVDADVSSTVPDLITLLRHPRLKLLDRHPIPVRNPAGTLLGKLTVNLPLENHLDFKDVGIHAQGQLSGLRLGGLVAGRDLDRGDIAMDVTADALKASGRATVGGIPAALTVDMDFRPGPPSQVVQRATATGVATVRQLAAAGLDAGTLIGPGSGGFTATYQTQRDGQGEVSVQADLRDTAMAVAGWTKPQGQPASVSARLLLNADRLQGIADLQAQGPGMQVRGRAEMVGDKPARLVLDPIVLGQTRARGDIRLPVAPNEPIRATLTGTVLDLSTELTRKPPTGATSSSAEGGSDTPWIADVNFQKVILAGERSVGAVTAHAEYDGKRLRALQLQSGGPERLQAVIKPQGNGRQVSVRAQNAGELLRALDVVQTVVGGQFALDGRYDDSGPVSVLSGTADLRQFHIRDAPAVGKLLQALTVYGIGEAMSTPGLLFSQMTAPFRWNGDVLELDDAQAFSASLGLTARGRIDTARKAIDLKGTIVPAYALNSALGRIPLLGGLFSAERGGGLVSVEYSVRGPLSDPAVAVNPLSALTPGFLRRLFRIFD